MSWFSDLFAGGIKGIMDGAKSLISEFHLSPEQQKQFEMGMEALVQKRLSELEQTTRQELTAKENILVAELQQGDSYTKRARPTVVYVGLAFVGINYVLFPVIGWFITLYGIIKGTGPLPTLPVLSLPPEFWLAWGGITSTWAIGRTVEKVKAGGFVGKVSQVITGTRAGESILSGD